MSYLEDGNKIELFLFLLGAEPRTWCTVAQVPYTEIHSQLPCSPHYLALRTELGLHTEIHPKPFLFFYFETGLPHTLPRPDLDM